MTEQDNNVKKELNRKLTENKYIINENVRTYIIIYDT